MSNGEDYKVFTPVERSAAPEPTVTEDGAILVRVGLNTEPDGHWERFFNEKYAQFGPGAQPTISRRDRNAHPGLRSPGPAIHFRVRDAEELKSWTHEIDQMIEAANATYIEVHVPAEERKAEEERAREAARAAAQAELNQVAAELSPPGGDPAKPKRTPVRIPTRTPNLRRW